MTSLPTPLGQADTWSTIEAIIEAALDMPPAQRAWFLNHHCRDRPSLLLQCQELLGDERDSSPLNSFIDVEGTEAVRAGMIALADDYRLGGEIGSGGSAQVYYARCRKTGAPVALKLLKPIHNNPLQRRHLLREEMMLARIQHPNVVRLWDAGPLPNGRHYLATEYVNGHDILEYCNHNRLDRNQRLRLFRKLCDVIDDCHKQHIIHLDLKPANIMVTKDGTLKLIDFGLAHWNPYRGFWIAEQPAMLTAEYASPELLAGRSFNHQSDIYALGVLLYELLTGIHPFEGVAPHDLIQNRDAQTLLEPSTSMRLLRINAGGRRRLKHLAAQRAVADAFIPDMIDARLDQVVLKAMHADPGQRYNSCTEMSQDVLRYLLGFTTPNTRDRFWQRTLKWLRRFDLAA